MPLTFHKKYGLEVMYEGIPNHLGVARPVPIMIRTRRGLITLTGLVLRDAEYGKGPFAKTNPPELKPLQN
jgi:hypothetical protein